MVKIPTAKRIPATRFKYRAWEETSITTWVHPSSAIRRRRPWSSKDSGVVRSVGRISPPIMFWLVPMSPTFAPAACSRISLRR